ncbi:MAG: hypothetical protein LBQ24_05425 [Candidatus Peribacteria bacterium]|jgi:hypothetical protein|nr:hypothetical protein [Candidatus Peribacteria bacterium]
MKKIDIIGWYVNELVINSVSYNKEIDFYLNENLSLINKEYGKLDRNVFNIFR